MPTADETYNKFNYLLRPSKQIERKLLIETLSRLAAAGYSMRDYTYLGLGSPFYADFILFHKYLHIDRMICAEQDDIPNRMTFNLPFSAVRLFMRPVGQIGPELDRMEKHLVWLDYDYSLDRTVLQDMGVLLSILPPGSILIVTVAAQPNLPSDSTTGEPSMADRQRLAIDYDVLFGSVHPDPPAAKDLTRKGLPAYFAKVLHSHIKNELGRRTDGTTEFLQLFNFRYADGMQMVTYGGIIERPGCVDRIGDAGVFELPFVQSEPGAVPLEISVPPLTSREKLWLDQRLPKGVAEDELEFEIDPVPLENYQRYYRYYPSYIESLF